MKILVRGEYCEGYSIIGVYTDDNKLREDCLKAIENTCADYVRIYEAKENEFETHKLIWDYEVPREWDDDEEEDIEWGY